jgi:hypothetical protein
MTGGDTPEPVWRIPPAFRGSYALDETGQHVVSVERTVVRRNGYPYRVREHLLKERRHHPSGKLYVKLASGVRGRCKTIYRRAQP